MSQERTKSRSPSRILAAASIVFLAGALITALSTEAFAWTGPSQTAPSGNVSAPLNTGSTAQSKAGGLLLNTGAATNGLIVQYGNVGIGATSPAYKLDVAGTIRSSSGGIVFPDGTTQTTAAASGLYGFSSDIRTETRDDAGLMGATAKSGFFQTSVPTNYPSGASSWWHLLDIRHTNTTNNYALQLAGSFFDQDLYFRKTNNSASTGWSKVIAANSSGNVGIGASPQVKLDVRGEVQSRVDDANIGGILSISNGAKAAGTSQRWRIYNMGGTYGNSLQFWAYDDISGLSCAGGLCASRVTFLDTGNVGIGVSSPSYKLDVAGQVNAQSTSGSGGYISSGNYGGTGSAAYFPQGLWSNGSSAWIYGSIYTNGALYDTASRWSINPAGSSWFNGGNVGIGISSPAQKLDVNGYLKVRSTNGEGGTIQLDGANGTSMWVENINGKFRLINSPWTSELFGVDQSGNTTIIGNMYAAAYYHNSDARLKDNVQTSPGLALVQKLRGVTFDWKKDGTPSAGVIAQEVEKVMPSAVKEDEKGMKTVEYDQLVAPLIEAIKEQQERIETLSSQNERQQAAIEALRNEVDLLKKDR